MVPENRRLFAKMTVRENLEIGAKLRRKDKDAVEETSSGSSPCSRDSKSESSRRPEPSRAASSRCWRSAAR